MSKAFLKQAKNNKKYKQNKIQKSKALKAEKHSHWTSALQYLCFIYLHCPAQNASVAKNQLGGVLWKTKRPSYS